MTPDQFKAMEDWMNAFISMRMGWQICNYEDEAQEDSAYQCYRGIAFDELVDKGEEE
jgi:hypothetical protein